MAAWILSNMATIIVAFVLVMITSLVIRKLVKDKKSGKGCCGCSGCNGCSGCGCRSSSENDK